MIPPWSLWSEALNGMRDEVHELAKSKGWHDDEPLSVDGIAAKLTLIHSEVSEALEEVRNGETDRVVNGKPEGISYELADVLIRVLDLCGKLEVDIGHAVHRKHAFNMSRSHRHGGKKL